MSWGRVPLIHSVGGTPTSFTANFSTNENPLRRAGYTQDCFFDGAADAIDWTNMKTVGGRAFAASNVPVGVADSIAVLNPTIIAIPARQFVQGTVYIDPAAGPITNSQEVELHGRTTLGANSITSYEIDISRDTPGITIVRWEGAEGSLTVLQGDSTTVNSGDVFRAEFVTSGSNVIITTFRNSVQIQSFTDINPGSVYLSGSCGLAAFMRADTLTDLGWSAWSCGTF